MIDPNLHSCGSVAPHGARELAHPETSFYIAGMKSYGRAPTFLMLAGYEQIRSIAAELAGDPAAAARVELVLPETGMCSTSRASPALLSAAGDGGCCADGEPAAAAEPALPVACGCGEPPAAARQTPTLTACC